MSGTKVEHKKSGFLSGIDQIKSKMEHKKSGPLSGNGEQKLKFGEDQI